MLLLPFLWSRGVLLQTDAIAEPGISSNQHGPALLLIEGFVNFLLVPFHHGKLIFLSDKIQMMLI